MTCPLRNQINKAKNLGRMASLLGPPRKSNRKRRRNRKLISFSNSPTNSTTISIWRTRRSNLPSRSFRTVLMRSRKTRTGRCRWPSNGTTKPRKSRLTTWIQFHKCRLDSSETLIGRASTHTVSILTLFISNHIAFNFTESTKSKASYM